METQSGYVFTPERREEIRRDLARRKLTMLMLLAGALTIAAGVLAIQWFTGSVFGLNPRLWIPALIAYLALESIAAVQIWRCPACRRRLPLDLNPVNCYGCGAVFK